MGLYRRLGELEDRQAIDAFAAELIDRFGTLPEETANLMKIVEVKLNCRDAMVAKLDIGPRGAVVTFAKGGFPGSSRASRLYRSLERRSEAETGQQDDRLARLADRRCAPQRRRAVVPRPRSGRCRRGQEESWLRLSLRPLRSASVRLRSMPPRPGNPDRRRSPSP